LAEGDLLIAMTEQAPGLLGSPLTVPKSDSYLHNQRLGKAVKRSTVETAFLFELMNTASIRRRIRLESTGTKVKHTSPSRIEAIEIGVPPLGRQQLFAQIFYAIRRQKDKLQAHLTELDTLFASLQSRAFRGEL
jgi:type I restriction enzyme S subunit